MFLARGRLLKTKRREAYHLAKAEEKGKERARIEAIRKKPLDVSIREHFEKFIDKLDSDQAIKIVSWVGLAYILKPILDTIEVVQEKLKTVKLAKESGGLWYDIVFRATPGAVLGELIAAAIIPMPGVEEKLKSADMETWILAFVVAGLIITFGPALIQTFGGLGNLAVGILGGGLTGI